MINMTVTHADASSLYLSKFYWSWRHFLFSYTIQMVQLVKLDIASFLKLHMEWEIFSIGFMNINWTL